ncbi:hypothetical protein NM208_g569 [Fusarium decemcellulare]|uniref:Uncharacterized protein n=2 Tax=Fusarium decemcellulare TaxID=57161 RepID=A0ACC1SYJ7_9HYPO|nr:hypothetical protein NM208_g744 [Fusarium decemcellulare]KAJ3549318.1 hypothetical protein NM208_g569 [Fusarium decemcellulare]
MITANATRIIRRWDDTLAKLEAISARPETMVVHDQNGKVLLTQEFALDYNGEPNVYTHRSRTQRLMYDYALQVGVEFVFGKRITDYWEDAARAGIYIDGEKIEADAVVAADGVRSKARRYVTGIDENPKRSGFAVYRSWFSMDALDDELTRGFATCGKDMNCIWIGTDIHAIVTTNNNLRSVTAFVTHKDDYTLEESWSTPGRTEDMLKVVADWDPRLRAVIEKVPDGAIIDYKLLWRDPVQQWTSKNGRLLLVGDAAHPHLATSGAGGGQAIEDGATLAALIDRSGRKDIPMAFKAFEKLRYERNCLTQRMGWETRHKWHQTDWERFANNPEYLKLPQPAWLYGSDAEAYGYDNYDAVVSHIKIGTPFHNTNIMEGYIHEDWTVNDLMNMERKVGNKDTYLVK